MALQSVRPRLRYCSQSVEVSCELLVPRWCCLRPHPQHPPLFFAPSCELSVPEWCQLRLRLRRLRHIGRHLRHLPLQPLQPCSSDVACLFRAWGVSQQWYCWCRRRGLTSSPGRQILQLWHKRPPVVSVMFSRRSRHNFASVERSLR